MSHIRLPTKDELSGAARELVEDSERRWGYVANIVRAYALAPDLQEAEDVWSKGVLHRGRLSRRLKEAIGTVVSAANGCTYCATSHAHAVALSGGTLEEGSACLALRLDAFPPAERAALEFAARATRDPRAVGRADYEQLLRHYDEGEIVEIVGVIQAFMGYNWFVTVLGLDLEEANPLAAARRAAPE